MKDIIFVFFDPWSVYQNYHRQITMQIIENGYNLVRYRFKKLTDSDIEQVYRKNTPISSERSWHIPKEIYTMGVSCGLLLAFHSGRDGYDDLKKLKGKSQPLLNSQGTIRFDYKAPNKSLSLLHTSDDFESTLLEGAVFFSKDEILMVQAPHARFNLFSEYHVPCAAINQTSAVCLLLKVRLRILEGLKKESNDNFNTLEVLVFKYLNNDFSSLTVEEETKIYLDFIREEEQTLRTELGFSEVFCSSIPTWYSYSLNLNYWKEGLKVLNNVKSYPHVNSKAFIDSIPVFYDPWEEVLFKTTLFHFPELITQIQ